MIMRNFKRSSRIRKLRDDRLALFLPSLRGGGAERVMLTLANHFVAQGHPVDLVLAKAEGPYLADVSPRVRIIDLNASRVMKSLPGLTLYLRRQQPIALLSAMAHANVIAGLSRMLARVPTRFVVTEHNDLSALDSNGDALSGRVLLYLMRAFYATADSVVAVSEGVKDSLAISRARPEASIEVIYNPIVDDSVVARSYEVPDHPWLSSFSKTPVVLGVGRLTEQKDFALLIRAFARVRKRMDARLIILGEGKQRLELESLVQELGLAQVVSLPGFVRNPYSCLRRAAVFALSSRSEGLSNVLIEAMACGTAVIATNCPSGPAEVLQHGKFGTLVPVGDVEAMANALYDSLQQGKAPESVFERAKDFGVDRAVTSYLNLLVPSANAL